MPVRSRLPSHLAVPLGLVLASCAGCAGPAVDVDGVDTDVPDTVDDTDPPPDTDTDVESDTPDDTDPVVDTDRPVGLVQGGVVTCAHPEARQERPFDALGFEVGQAPIAYLPGAGSAVEDFDGDGDLDVLLVGATEVVMLWAESDGYRRASLLTQALDDPHHGLFSAAAADYDADGDVDVIVTGYFVPTRLLANDGAGAFTDVTAAVGLDLPPDHATAAAVWGDLNDDGALDLILAGHGFVPEGRGLNPPASEYIQQDSYLFLSDGAGHFVDRSDLFDPELHDGFTFLVALFDADGDGDDDLYFVNDFGQVHWPCHVALKEGGRFVYQTNALTLEAQLSCMGVGVGQLGLDDPQEALAVPAFAESRLFLQRRGSWFDVARARGYRPVNTIPGERQGQAMGWGAEIVDVDNDGRVDLPTAYGHLATDLSIDELLQNDMLFLQRQDGTFEDVAPAWGLDDDAPTRSISYADLNRDGWPDLIRTGAGGPARLYLSRCGSEAWLDVRVEQPGPNPRGIGATVRVIEDSEVRFGRIRAGGTGYGSSRPPEVHFGLGDIDVIDRVEVVWPDGVVQSFTDVPTRQRLMVRR